MAIVKIAVCGMQYLWDNMKAIFSSKLFANFYLLNCIILLPALTHQSVLDLNAACRSKRTKAYWLFSS